ncbi:MAG: hypothetical protein AAF667_19330 [Pseudomonadota bacterium]
MKTLIATSALALALASAANAQTVDLTAMSNLEKQVIDVLLANDVPASVVTTLTLGQIAQIKAIMDNGDLNDGEKRNRVKAILGL